MKNKRGNILIDDVLFILLNLLILSVILVFVIIKVNGVFILEEKYSKEIALLIDGAKPEMRINLNMENAIKKAKKEGISPEKIVQITGNIVTVKLSEKSGYTYSFFNNIIFEDGNKDKSHYYPNEDKTGYVFVIK